MTWRFLASITAAGVVAAIALWLVATGPAPGQGGLPGGATGIPGGAQYGKLNVSDKGTCVMAAGTCGAQALVGGYGAAPTCFATWNGTGTCTGILKAPSTASAVTPASSVGTDTCNTNWVCFGW